VFTSFGAIFIPAGRQDGFSQHPVFGDDSSLMVF
jgi:hypothetical protein